MKRLLLVLLLICLGNTTVHASLKVLGKGDAMHLDPSGFPPAMKARYEIMKSKCATCHSLEWTIVALQTGIAPISGQPFDRAATRAYGIKMLRKPNSNMTKQEVKEVVELMNFLLDEAAR